MLMEFTLQIDCGDPDKEGDTIVEIVEIVEILRWASQRVGAGNLNFPIRNQNGAHIGFVTFREAP
jgi:hypothetical protein